MKFTHDIQTWFGGNNMLLSYFEHDFHKNTIGSFKVPASTANRFNGMKADLEKETVIGALGEIAIDVIASSSKGMRLKQFPWGHLEEDTRNKLKEAVAEIIQHAVLNKNVWEKINASSLSTGNFNVQSDATNWLLTNDIIGQIARTSIMQSGINEYEWMTEGQVYTGTANGNIKVLARADLDTLPEIGGY